MCFYVIFVMTVAPRCCVWFREAQRIGTTRLRGPDISHDISHDALAPFMLTADLQGRTRYVVFRLMSLLRNLLLTVSFIQGLGRRLERCGPNKFGEKQRYGYIVNSCGLSSVYKFQCLTNIIIQNYVGINMI